MIDLAILGLLADQDLHGYELKKQLADLPGVRSVVSFGSLYPALARLERGGLVAATGTEPSAPIPMTGSLDGEVAAFRALRGRPRLERRGRKGYRLTELGRSRLTELLLARDRREDERSFALKLAFARHLEPEQRLELLESRRAELAMLAAERRRERGRLLDRYRRALHEHEDDATRRDLDWLDDLIEAERAERPDGTPDRPTIGGIRP